MKNPLTYIDLFAGCGGLSLGLHKAGWKGLFAIEKSKDAFETLEHNLINNLDHFQWPSWLEKKCHEIDEILGSYESELTKLQNQVDLIAGGPPCQGFSTAGRRNEDDVRNGLVKSYLRFIDLVKPKLIFFENVKGFTLKFKKNKSKGIIYSNFVVDELSKQGYEVFGKLIDFSKFGIPQKRTRFILVGIRRDIASEKNISARQFFKLLVSNKKPFLKSKELPSNPTVGGAISDLLFCNGVKPTPDRKGFFSGIYRTPRSKYQQFLRANNTADIPNSHSFPKHKDYIKKRFAYLIRIGEGKSISEKTRKKLNISKHTIIPLQQNLKSPTITTLPDDYIHFLEPRILTVREYARLQSFPDSYEFKGKYTTGGKLRKIEVPRYTQIGNAIPPIFSEQSGVALKLLIAP